MRVIVAIILIMLLAGCISGTPETPPPERVKYVNILEKEIVEEDVIEDKTPEIDVVVEEEKPVEETIEIGDDKMAENPVAVINTNKGEFRFELYSKRAPITVTNFIELAESGFYTGLKFHRYEPGFVIQGGDPKGDGTGGSPNQIKLEIHPELKHVEGAIGMARSQAPDSASSQFYVSLAPIHSLDGNYAVFGIVTQGMDVVLSLRQGDIMNTVTIEK